MDTRPSALLVVAAGGAAGALARWAIVAVMPTLTPGVGWGTLTVNLVGCFLLGAVVAGTEPDSLLRLGLGTGALGGFTTFSTLVVEADLGLSAERPELAWCVLAVSLVGGVALARLGELVGTP